ncbi:hypothetical protein M9H77_23048 [Catharanthus roseus]|uniref:Uncharacterized protein n=1 Tax=Catharanthus roseus TaxID=4058 RepID=A0ACC0ATY1_CATRO|nr:hypothetical protein M9H77_23048 [Catharanthus roseus]
MKFVTVSGAKILTTFDDVFYIIHILEPFYKFSASRKFSPFWTVFIEILGNFQANKMALHQYDMCRQDLSKEITRIDSISPFNGLKFGCPTFPLS